MNSLRLSLIPIVDMIRGFAGPELADIRINQVTIRTRAWTGPRLRMGTSSDVDLVLPREYPIRYVTAQEIISAAGLYETGDILVDHITPSDGNGTGYTQAQLRPVVTSDNVEIIYVITGTTEGDGHAGEYLCVDIRTYRAFTSQLVLRRRTTTP